MGSTFQLPLLSITLRQTCRRNFSSTKFSFLLGKIVNVPAQGTRSPLPHRDFCPSLFSSKGNLFLQRLGAPFFLVFSHLCNQISSQYSRNHSEFIKTEHLLFFLGSKNLVFSWSYESQYRSLQHPPFLYFKASSRTPMDQQICKPFLSHGLCFRVSQNYKLALKSLQIGKACSTNNIVALFL